MRIPLLNDGIKLTRQRDQIPFVLLRYKHAAKSQKACKTKYLDRLVQVWDHFCYLLDIKGGLDNENFSEQEIF